MTRRTQRLSLLGGIFLVLFGLVKLYQEADWILLIFGILIVAFTLSNMVRGGPGKP
jgi:hypothetical protein